VLHVVFCSGNPTIEPDMMKRVITFIRQRILAGRIPEGRSGIRILGHRQYVGGRWEYIGKLQFDYIISQGMQPSDCFLDVACGALRGGIHFIRFLDKGHYLGIDKEKELVEIGIEKEVGRELFEEKAPEFVISDCFEFEKFSRKPQYAIALSLFTHLNSRDIELCLGKLSEFAEPGHQFFATFFEGRSSTNREKSHSLDHFEYAREEMIAFGEKHNWESIYVGDWNHPRDQMMMKYVAR